MGRFRGGGKGMPGGNSKKQRARPTSWRRLGLIVGAAGVLGLGVWCCRGLFVHRAAAQPSPTAAAAAAAEEASTAPGSSDYGSRVVAYINQGQPVTRQE